MGNKLKDIFSDEMFGLGGSIQFKNKESHEKFLKTVQIVLDRGDEVDVEGVASFITNVKWGGGKYPVSEQKELSQFTIAPSIREIPIKVNTTYGEQTFIFKCYQTTKEIVCETDKDKIVYFKIILQKDTLDTTITYRTQPQFAKTVKNIIESYNATIKLLEKVFKYDEGQALGKDYEVICNARDFFAEAEKFFGKLYLLEKELGISFKIDNLTDEEKDVIEVEELYLLLISKKVIRLNAKFNATESTQIVMSEGVSKPEIGTAVDITFSSEGEYSIYGEKITVYTASLLSNALIKEVEEDKEGRLKVLYGDTDSQPMYISFTGFKTPNEAKQEKEIIMKKKEKYISALTVNEYISKGK